MRTTALTTNSITRRWAAGLALLVAASVFASCVPPAPEPPTQEPPPSAPSAASAANWLLGKAAAYAAPMAANFIMSELGLNSLIPVSDGQKLDEIKLELDAISAKLDQVNRSLNTLTGQFAQGALTAQLTALRDESRDVGVLYNEQFRPMLTAGIEHQDAKESGDQQRIADAFDKLIRRRNQFYVAYDRLGASSLAGKISDRLVPGDASSALTSKGLVQLTRPGARYFTAADSAEIRAVYDNFAEYEALAAWMRMERWIPSNPPPPGDTKEGIIENFETARREYLDQTMEEHAGLPPEIPADVVIDAGTQPLATSSPTMWLPVASAVHFRPNHRDPGSVPALLDGLNLDPFRSFGDWHIPTRVEVTSLLSGFTPATGSTPNTFLAGLNPSSTPWRAIAGSSPWPYVWTRDVANAAMTCLPQLSGGSVSVNVPRQIAITTSAAAASAVGQPPLPNLVRGDLNSPPSCDDFLDGVFAAAPAAGGFLAARTMGPTWTEHLAQRSGPYVRANADLRLADLSRRFLAGVDLTASDLRGARLIDTDLGGANLTGVDLRGATLTGTNLHDADLTGAKLAGVTTSRLEGRPKALPAGWTVANGHLVGPGVALAGADLRNAELHGVDLTGANLADSDLTGANLTGANLSGANLTRVHLVDADLTGARLTGATLTGATLQGVTLRGVSSGGIVATAAVTLPGGWRLIAGHLVGPDANLTGGNLAGANLTGMDLSGADLTGTHLTNATLTDVRLTGAIVAGALFGTDDDNKFRGVVSGGISGLPAQLPASGRYRVVEGYLVGPSANLTGATFSPTAQLGVSLSATDFTNADLTGLVLTGAFMNNANLTGAVLTGTNLSGVNLSAATLTGVVSGGIVGNPVLPAGWSLVDGVLVDGRPVGGLLAEPEA